MALSRSSLRLYSALLLVLATIPLRAASEHRIGVRVVNGDGEFVDRLTGRTFVPRGFNYIRLAPQQENGAVYHSTFDPARYDKSAAHAALAAMHDAGYNTVRVFINEAQVARTVDGLATAYLANVVDFLQLAREQSMFVFVVLPNIPGYRYFVPIPPGWSFFNTIYLQSAAVKQKQQYLRDFIIGLQALNAPMDAVFAWEVENEIFFDSNASPLVDTSGAVSTANGNTYDLTNPADKERMVNDNLVYWIDQMRAAILEVDSTALVGAGFFWDQQPHPARPGDPRVIHPHAAIARSAADFIDLHPYPGNGLTIDEMSDNFGIDGLRTKPLLMGEFGLQRSPQYAAGVAAQVLQDWQVRSCSDGYDGWLMWTWDTDDVLPEGAQFWSATADAAVINAALSPSHRPDPCKSGSFPGKNFALRSAVRSSSKASVQPPELAVDGLWNTAWNSGASSPQWIEIDLGVPTLVTRIRLVVNQQPSEGFTVHRVWARGAASTEDEELVHEFRGVTTQGQVLDYTVPAPGPIARFIKVETIESPSWVSWLEVEVYGRDTFPRRRAVRR